MANISMHLPHIIHASLGAMPNEESVLVLMGKTAMDKTSYNRILPGITTDKTLFPSTAENNSIDENVVCVYHGMK